MDRVCTARRRHWVSKSFSGPIWEGIYPDFESAKAVGDGFSGQKWTESVKAAAESISGESSAALSGSLLPIVASIAQSRQEIIRILDFGGGPGVTFAAVRNAVKGRPLDYHVVENRNV